MIYLFVAIGFALIWAGRWLKNNPQWIEQRHQQQIDSGKINPDSSYPSPKMLTISCYALAASLFVIGATLDNTAKTADLVATVNSSSASKSEIAAAKQSLIKRHFNTISSVPISLKQRLDTLLTEPSSLQVIKVNHWDRSDYIAVKVEYRANNAAGQTTNQYLLANLNWAGQVIDIIETGVL